MILLFDMRSKLVKGHLAKSKATTVSNNNNIVDELEPEL